MKLDGRHTTCVSVILLKILEKCVLLQVLEFESKLTRMSSGNLTSVSEVLEVKNWFNHIQFLEVNIWFGFVPQPLIGPLLFKILKFEVLLVPFLVIFHTTPVTGIGTTTLQSIIFYRLRSLAHFVISLFVI